MLNFTEYIVLFSTFWPLAGRSNWSILLDMLHFLTFRPLAGRSNWLILLNIFEFFDFLTFRAVGKMVGGQMINFTEYIGFFRFSTSWSGVKMMDFTEYIGFFRLFEGTRWVSFSFALSWIPPKFQFHLRTFLWIPPTKILKNSMKSSSQK